MPTSRRNSIAPRPDVQLSCSRRSHPSANHRSRRTAPTAPGCAVPLLHGVDVFNDRSPASRGSPIIPVARHQHDRPVAGALKSLQCQQRHQVSGVQTRRRRIETRIDRERTGVVAAASASISVDCAISPRHPSSSRIAVPMSRSSRIERSWSLPPGAGARGLRRYVETSGRPCEQKRHGRSAAWLTPTRGPRATAPVYRVPTTGESAAKISIPLSSIEIPSAAQIPRTSGQRRRSVHFQAPSSGDLDARFDGGRPEEDSRRRSIRAARHVGAHVNSMTSIRVEPSGRSEHHSRSAPGPRTGATPHRATGRSPDLRRPRLPQSWRSPRDW